MIWDWSGRDRPTWEALSANMTLKVFLDIWLFCTAVSVSLSGCNAGWTYFGHTGKCYKSFESRLTRADALQACKEANPTASLVSIPDMKTNNFVLSMVGWRSWTGLEKVNVAWVWPDGSEDTLANWIPQQPSGDGSSVEIVKNRGIRTVEWPGVGVERTDQLEGFCLSIWPIRYLL